MTPDLTFRLLAAKESHHFDEDRFYESRHDKRDGGWKGWITVPADAWCQCGSPTVEGYVEIEPNKDDALEVWADHVLRIVGR